MGGMLSQAQVLRQVSEAFERLGIRYLVCGSVASSVHGTPRSTLDIDLLADIRDEHIAGIVWELGQDFFIDAEGLEESIRRRRSFNLLHVEGGYKVDVFPAAASAYHRKELDRAVAEPYPGAGEDFAVPVATPEDTILSKLVWFRQGGEVSERQWNDVRGVVAVCGSRLDREYLREWGDALGVRDLLARVLG